MKARRYSAGELSTPEHFTHAGEVLSRPYVWAEADGVEYLASVDPVDGRVRTSTRSTGDAGNWYAPNGPVPDFVADELDRILGIRL